MIKLADTGFTLIPEGTQVLKIVEVDYDEKFGKMKKDGIYNSYLKPTDSYTLRKKLREVEQ